MSQHLKPEHKPAHIVLGVSAGIAAYKAAYLLRLLQKEGFAVSVVPTPASLEFVGKATWEGLTQKSVFTDVFHGGGADHVELARNCDALVIAPATADLIARVAHGQANDLLSTTVLASSCPVIVAPAMHTQMWNASATQENIKTLQERGFIIVGPEKGDLASGDSGAGRMSEPEDITAQLTRILASRGELFGKRIIVTAGGTREALDPVRFLGNRSSGRQGIEIAREAARRGAEVTLLASNIDPSLLPHQCTVIQASSAAKVYSELFERLESCDALVMAAAVADYRPKAPAASKIKKEEQGMAPPTIELEETTDILKAVTSSPQRPPVVVGFAAETGDTQTVLEYGRAKARRKNADYLAVNCVGESLGFGDVPNYVYVMDTQGSLVTQGGGTKADVARTLVDLIAQRLTTIEA